MISILTHENYYKITEDYIRVISKDVLSKEIVIRSDDARTFISKQM